MPLHQLVSLFEGAPFRWWVSGGLALELHVGRSWRSHEDTDIGVSRSEASLIHTWLTEWEMWVAASGVLSLWNGETLDPDVGQSNVWMRRSSESPWVIDLTVGDGNSNYWIYRRDRNIRRNWDEAILLTRHDVPYLAPELQLLFKSKNMRAKDDHDARMVIPLLSAGPTQFLTDHLPGDHRWRNLLAG